MIPLLPIGTSDLVIGKTNTSNQGNYFPVGFDDNYSYTQQIYHSDEIGEARPINAIDIQYFYGTQKAELLISIWGTRNNPDLQVDMTGFQTLI